MIKLKQIRSERYPLNKLGEKGCTPLKINMEPKNGGLEDDFPFQGGDFQVPC